MSRFDRNNIPVMGNQDWLPGEVTFAAQGGPPLTVELTSYEKMEQLSARVLVMRAKNLQEKIGSDLLPPLQGWQHETVCAWLIRVQAALASKALGMRVTPADFGAPFEPALLSSVTKHNPNDYDLKGYIDHSRGAGAAAAMTPGITAFS